MGVRGTFVDPIVRPVVAAAGQHGLPWEPAGGGTAYNFAAYATPSLHLRAAFGDPTITVTGLGVSAWTDLAGNWTVTQATDADRPAFLSPGVDFDVSNTESFDLSGGTIGVPTMTLFCDIDIGSTGATRFLVDLDGAGGRFIFALGGSGNLMGFFDGSHRAIAIATTGRQKLRWVYAGGAPGVGEMFRNGVSLGTVATGTVTPGLCNSAFISQQSSDTAHCDATLYRMILYPTAALTAAQCAEIEANL